MSRQPRPGQWQSVTTDVLDFEIAEGETTSNALDLQGTFLVGLIIPSAFTGTQIKFYGSRDGTDFYLLNNTLGDDLVATVVTNQATSICPQDFAMWRYLKLEAVTAQSSDVTIGAVTRPLS